MMYFKSYLKLSIKVCNNCELWVALSFTRKLESLVDSNAWSLTHSMPRLVPKCQKIWKSLLSLKSYARTGVPSAKLWNSSAQVEGNIATLTVRLETVGAGRLISVEQLKKSILPLRNIPHSFPVSNASALLKLGRQTLPNEWRVRTVCERPACCGCAGLLIHLLLSDYCN